MIKFDKNDFYGIIGIFLSVVGILLSFFIPNVEYPDDAISYSQTTERTDSLFIIASVLKNESYANAIIDIKSECFFSKPIIKYSTEGSHRGNVKYTFTNNNTVSKLESDSIFLLPARAFIKSNFIKDSYVYFSRNPNIQGSKFSTGGIKIPLEVFQSENYQELVNNAFKKFGLFLGSVIGLIISIILIVLTYIKNLGGLNG
ncbi:MAG: hypothetical protein HYV29_00185 [Ignavibacteriales bacterium]|nr:hypothetical protein [Ignavibacteriales bacterium]